MRITNLFLLPALIVGLGLILAGRVTAQIFTNAPCPACAGANNDPSLSSNAAPMAAQLGQGGWQEEAIGPTVGRFAAMPETALFEPGANVMLGLTNNEPTIAADLNNPLRLAVATYLRIRVSTNGGVSFEPLVLMTAPAGFSTARGGDSSLSYDSRGRLFWTFLLYNTNAAGFDVFLAQCNPTTGAILPGYPVNVTAAAGLPTDGINHNHDKEWLAVDASSTSPFRDRLYVVWTDFISTSPYYVIRTTSSADQGATWTPALALSTSSEGFVWPAQNTVAPNGDVYAAYHSQTAYTCGSTGCNPDGASGKIFVLRSINGGATYAQKRLAYTPGRADVTDNDQSGPRRIPGTQFWLQGTVQPQILADPNVPGRIYIIANDQPNAADFADVYIATSTNYANTWSAPARIDSGAAGTFQVMPCAAIDPVTGGIVVTYYDNRNGWTNSDGNFLLDVFATTSINGGATFTPDFQINTAPFDPDLNARCRFGCSSNDTVSTLRIGEYNGVAVAGGVALAVWTGNNATAARQDTVFNLFSAVGCTLNCPTTVTQANDPGLCGASVNYPAPTTSGGCGVVTCSPPPGSFFAVGTNTVTCTSATGSNCTFNVIVNDTEPPQVNCPADIVSNKSPDLCGNVVTFAAPFVRDNCDPSPTVTCTPASGSTFPLGVTTVICEGVDASGNSNQCSFTVTVINQPPVTDASATPTLIISPNGTNATVILDGSRSSDPDGDLLQYAWYETGAPTRLASGVVAVAVLPAGAHPLLLVVNDCSLADTNAVTIQVITSAEAANRLAATLSSDASRVQPLVATLRAALASIDRGNRVSAINQLLAFQNQIRAQVTPLDSALAASLIQSAQEIIDALSGGNTNPADRLHGRFTSLTRQSNGHVRMQFSGEAGATYIIEASTNLVNWEMIGAAAPLAEGQFEFEDTRSVKFSNRFYRVRLP